MPQGNPWATPKPSHNKPSHPHVPSWAKGFRGSVRAIPSQEPATPVLKCRMGVRGRAQGPPLGGQIPPNLTSDRPALIWPALGALEPRGARGLKKFDRGLRDWKSHEEFCWHGVFLSKERNFSRRPQDWRSHFRPQNPRGPVAWKNSIAAFGIENFERSIVDWNFSIAWLQQQWSQRGWRRCSWGWRLWSCSCRGDEGSVHSRDECEWRPKPRQGCWTCKHCREECWGCGCGLGSFSGRASWTWWATRTASSKTSFLQPCGDKSQMGPVSLHIESGDQCAQGEEMDLGVSLPSPCQVHKDRLQEESGHSTTEPGGWC